jgi:hypothetical protein
MSRLALKVAALLSATTTLLASSVASATNYSLWIHGRNPSQSGQIGNYADFSYWGPSSTAAGINKKAVNWAGGGHIAATNGTVRNALDCYCTGSNWCYVAAHSAGNAQIGYALALYGGSSRTKKNASPDSSGVCGNASTGGTQTGWNIKWVDVGGGAAGGSELANLGYWAVGDDITSDLRTSTMRSLYNHNTTQGKWFYMFAGAKGTAYSGILPGQDDEVVSYHSTGGLSATGSFCNPGDWFCDGDLNTGTTGSKNAPKWANHTVVLRDDSESYDHHTAGSWGGIMGPVRNDMVSYAY